MRRSDFPTDITIWQCLLEFGDARVGDLGVVEMERLQTGQSRQMHQPRVGDLSLIEIERLQTGQSLQMHQSRVGDLGVPEVERLQTV